MALQSTQATKWLGVMLDGQLSLKRHRDDFVAKGGKRANYLTSLSNTKWGIPPRLFKILMTSTVHAVTDYPAEAWLYLPIPKFFLEAMASIDAICATRALGVLRNSPRLFLRQDLDLQPPDVQLTFKILGTRAILAAKLPSHPRQTNTSSSSQGTATRILSIDTCQHV